MSLPDEILSEILSPALKVPDNAFSDTSNHRSPFANYTESTSAFLVVCKSWLRVSTPLLYHVVVLRSKPQATALSKALRKNPDLGRFIKKLRVEGGFGLPMHTILSLAPNITDLYLSLDIFSPDTTEGLCKGLPLINPSRLILQCEEPKERKYKNKNLRNLIDALHQVIPKWDHLIALGTPRNEWNGTFYRILFCIDDCKRLQYLRVETAELAAIAYDGVSACPIREIRVTAPLSKADVEFLKTESKIEALVVSEVIEEPPSVLNGVIPLLNPFFSPLFDVPKETQDDIWAPVLYFAMSIPEHVHSPAQRNPPPKLPLLLVSKQFHRLGLPLFYKDIVFSRYQCALDLVRVLESYPLIGSTIRTIHGDPDRLGWSFTDTEDSETDDDDSSIPYIPPVYRQRPMPPSAESFAKAMLNAVSQMTHLEQLNLLVDRAAGSRADLSLSRVELPMSWDGVVALGRTAGSSLRKLSVKIEAGDEEQVTPDAFSSFPVLETLRWKSSIVFDCMDIKDDGRALPHLQELEVLAADQSFFDALSLMKPMRLQRLILSPSVGVECQSFLAECGHTLTQLELPIHVADALEGSILDLCPSLVSLKIIWEELEFHPPSQKVLLPTLTTAESLLRITFDVDFKYKSHKRKIPDWTQYLTELPFDLMPNLSEISILEIGEWPTTQREISKSPWIPIAETVLKSNVSIVDKTGKKWRSRLKGRGRR
ncbi:hypothetical protein C8F01DRAFT_1033465 [Mycena amicta]|nr:hypothetical protein C8F01DRAFT_1033465 [Mycena amicta]